MDSEKYWQKRATEREAKWYAKSQSTIERELANYYKQALEAILDDIAALYGRFAKDNKLSVQEAETLLKGQEFRQWKKSLEEYVAEIENGNEWLKRELNTLAMRSRITRLDKLYSETLKELAKLDDKTADKLTDFLSEAYKDNYYQTSFDIDHTQGIHVAGTAVDSQRVEKVLKTPWSGQNYSKRIWKNSQKLSENLRKTMLDGVHRGLSIEKLSKNIQERMEVTRKQAVRLVRTELNYVQNQAALDSIKDSGMKYYKFLATLDKRTSTQCRSHDGNIYPIAEYSPGTNAPPLHPHCRSTIIGSLKASDRSKPNETRIARDSNAKNISVPASMTYQEWYNKYIQTSTTMVRKKANNGVFSNLLMPMQIRTIKEMVRKYNLNMPYTHFTWKK